MASRPLQYLTIFLTCFVDILGFGIVIPVLPLYAEHFGATAMQIGWLVGIFSLAQFFFAPHLGEGIRSRRAQAGAARRPGGHGGGLHADGPGRDRLDAFRCALDRWNIRGQHRRGAGLSCRYLDSGKPRQGDGTSWSCVRPWICLWPRAGRLGERYFQLRRTDVHCRRARSGEFLFCVVLSAGIPSDPIRRRQAK